MEVPIARTCERAEVERQGALLLRPPPAVQRSRTTASFGRFSVLGDGKMKMKMRIMGRQVKLELG